MYTKPEVCSFHYFPLMFSNMLVISFVFIDTKLHSRLLLFETNVGEQDHLFTQLNFILQYDRDPLTLDGPLISWSNSIEES